MTDVTKQMMLPLEHPTRDKCQWTRALVEVRSSTTDSNCLTVVRPPEFRGRYPKDFLESFPKKVNLGDEGDTKVFFHEIPHAGGTRKPSRK